MWPGGKGLVPAKTPGFGGPIRLTQGTIKWQELDRGGLNVSRNWGRKLKIVWSCNILKELGEA